jgi:TRAP-type uncharacterized transport system substrate-binding protein
LRARFSWTGIRTDGATGPAPEELMRKLPIAAALVLAGGLAVAEQKRISIATGGTGGVYYPLGGGLANILTRKIPGVEATAEVTSASVDNLKLVIYANKSQWVTVEGSGIERMQDLKGHRIATGAPGSGTEIIAVRILEAYGIDPDKDVRREKLSVAESVNAIKDRKIDAFFWSGGVPTASVTDLAATPGVKIKLLDHADALPKLVQKWGPLYVKGTIPAKSYPGQEKDVGGVDVWNLLAVSDKMDEQLAYQITKAVFESKDELAGVHAEAKNLEVQRQYAIGSPVPFHPGAARYLAEKGVKK